MLADSVVMPTLKNGIQPDGSRPWRRVYMPAGQRELPAALLIWANDWSVGRNEPLFFGPVMPHAQTLARMLRSAAAGELAPIDPAPLQGLPERLRDFAAER